MDNFLKTNDGFETTLKLIDTINRSTDDYLFIWNIPEDKRWFFGEIDKKYDVRNNGSAVNSTDEMMQVIYPADRPAVLKSLNEIATGKKDIHNMDYRWVTRDGQKVWINCHGTVIKDEEGNPHLMMGRVSEENLRHLFNPLTSLWNKNKLRLDLKQRLNDTKGYLMLLDIDGLAAINLSHGREYGDMLLKEVAEFCENLSEVHTAYHVDHNNFALLTELDSKEEVFEIYKALKEAMIDKCSFTASAVPIDNALFFDETQLLDSVNMTLKKAKDISNNRIEFFSAEDLSRKISSLELLEELKKSVENDFEGFEVYYQPQIRAGSYEIYGIEALLRYNSKTRGRVFPDKFIPILEESRLIKIVGLWVLRQALIQCKKWRESLPELHVSVNFSALQFEDLQLAEKVIAIVDEIGLPGDALTVEITESVELHNNIQLDNNIKYLKQHNINFAIDDFGTGYSNLGYLKQMNVDEIKIDRVFVNGIEKDTYNHKLISNVIEFARANSIRTCCEGVESTRELMTLETLLPDVIQGYLFDKPNTAEMIENTYILKSTDKFKERIEFLEKIREFKEKLGEHYGQFEYIYNTSNLKTYSNTSVQYLKNGEEFYKELIEDLKKAKKYIFMEYFIIERGQMWNGILEILEEKAKQGVDVRVMYDDIGTIYKLPNNYPKRMKKKGIKCVKFNSFVPIMSALHNNRDHRKITIVDGKVGYVSGLNIADEYINVVQRFGYWKDTGVRLKGEAIKSLLMMFLQLYNVQTQKIEDYKAYLKDVEPVKAKGFVCPFGDGPKYFYSDYIAENVYLNMINNAKDYVWITTPYLIIDSKINNALCAAAKRGVDVRIITPRIPDKKTIFMLTRSCYRVLKQAGVKIFEYEKGFVHAKQFLCDDDLSIVGTINLDYRSLMHHYECGVLMKGVDCIKDIKKDFENMFATSINMKDYKQNKFIRLYCAIIRAFTPML